MTHTYQIVGAGPDGYRAALEESFARLGWRPVPTDGRPDVALLLTQAGRQATKMDWFAAGVLRGRGVPLLVVGDRHRLGVRQEVGRQGGWPVEEMRPDELPDALARLGLLPQVDSQPAGVS